MPDSLAGFGVQSDQTIREEIVANAVHAVEIKSGGAGRSIDNSSLGIESHACPVVRGTGGFPSLCRPGLVSNFAGMRNGVKSPAQSAPANVVAAHVNGR